MIQGMYYEESASPVDSAKELKWWKVCHVFQWVFMVLSALAVLFILLFVLPGVMMEGTSRSSVAFTLITSFAFLAALVLTAILFWRMKLKRNVSYDYIFVEDELRISKVFNGKKRKNLCKLKADEMLKIGYCDRPSFETISHGYDKKHIVFLTPNYEPAEGKVFLYLVYSSPIGKTLYIIESRELILEYLVRAAGRNKFERQ